MPSRRFRQVGLVNEAFPICVGASVIGACFDDEFMPWSDAFMEDFRRRRHVAVLSGVKAVELAPALAFARALYTEMLGLPTRLVEVDDDTISLMQHYADRSVLGQRKPATRTAAKFPGA